MTLKGTQANRIANSNPKVYHLNKWDSLSHDGKLEIISEIIFGEGRDPSIAELTVKILKDAGAVPRDYKGQAAALLKWVQENIYYVNEPGERLQSPKYTLKRGFGDCDDMAIILCSMYESIGLKWRLVISGNKGSKRMRHIQGGKIPSGVNWAHIYCAVGNDPFNPTEWLFAEPTIKGVPLGWDVVNSNTNELPELLNPRYAGLGASGVGMGIGISAGTAASDDSEGVSLTTRLKEISFAITIGVATAVGTELLLEYIRSRRKE